jgi:hypothetical protein
VIIGLTRRTMPFLAALIALGCSQEVTPTPAEITTFCLEVRGQRYVLEKLHEEQRSVLDGKRAASAAQMDLLLARIKATESKIELAEYKASERGFRAADCKP